MTATGLMQVLGVMAFYQNIPPRAYTFKVVSTNGAGGFSRDAKFEFKLSPFFYQTLWFQGMCAFCAAALALVCMRRM